MYYDEYLESIFTPSGGSSLGEGEVSKIGRNSKEKDDRLLSYDDITISTLMYPGTNEYTGQTNGLDPFVYSSIDTYAKKLLSHLETIQGRNPSYKIYRDAKDKIPVLEFDMAYQRDMGDLLSDAMEAEKQFKAEQAMIKRYNELTNNRKYAKKEDDIKNIEKELDALKKVIPKKYFEEDQNVKNEPSPSKTENELQLKAVSSEEVVELKPQEQPNQEQKKEEQKANPVVVPAPVVNVTVPSPAIPKSDKEKGPAKPSSVIMPPAERTSASSTKESSKDKTLIQSISNSVFDQRILEYEKSNVTPLLKPGFVPPLPEKQTIRDTSTKENQNVRTIESTNDTSRATTVSDGASSVMDSELVKSTIEKSSTIVSNGISEVVKQQVTMIGSSVSSMLEASNTLKSAVDTFSSAVKDGALIIQTASNSSIKDGSSLSSSTASMEVNQGQTLETNSMSSEKLEKLTSILPQIQNKIVGMEAPQVPAIDVPFLASSISDSIKNAVTNITSQNKTMNYPGSNPATIPPKTPEVNPGNVQNTEGDTTNLANQMNQNLAKGGSSMPSVVSLSQSTIDNLASAIIKNMTLTPFLNSGRI